MREPCLVDGCRNDAAPNHKHCWSHIKQQTRFGAMRPLREYGRKPIDALCAAARRYADAADTPDEDRAKQTLRMSALRYGRSERRQRRLPHNVHTTHESGDH